MDGLTPNQYDLADRIEHLIENAPAPAGWTPSALGRRLHEDSVHVRTVLMWMVRNQFLVADRDDLNSRTHYYARKAGA